MRHISSVSAARFHEKIQADIQASIDRVANDLYVSDNWDALAARDVAIFSLPGSPDWVVYLDSDASVVNVSAASPRLTELRAMLRRYGASKTEKWLSSKGRSKRLGTRWPTAPPGPSHLSTLGQAAWGYHHLGSIVSIPCIIIRKH